MEILYGIPTQFLIVAAGVILFFFFYPILFKKHIIANLEKEARKSSLDWKDKYGIVHTDEVLFKKSKLPLIGDWGRIYPPVNENGSINWTNLIFGGKKNFIKLVVIMLIIGLTIYWVMGIVGTGAEYLNGNKYIIIGRPEFDKYCDTQLLQENVGNYSLGDNYKNITVFSLESSLKE